MLKFYNKIKKKLKTKIDNKYPLKENLYKEV